MTKCDVCGTEVEQVYVHASGIAAMSYGSCSTCLQAGAEPYFVLVGTFFTAVEANRPLAEGIDANYYAWLQDQLAYHGKTEDEFKQECMQAWEDYANHT